MRFTTRPDAIDPRIVFLAYAGLVGGAGLVVYAWPLRTLPDVWVQWLNAGPELAGLPWARFAIVRMGAALVTAFGLCALAFAAIEDPLGRRRALAHFAVVHLLGGLMLGLQWVAVLAPSGAAPPWLIATPFALGILLWYFTFTAVEAEPQRRLQGMISLMRSGRSETPTERLRSQYEEQIARIARQEERARLARDLHDAVKQQLFAIQTAAATVQARFDGDPAAAREAIAQVRSSAREATTEMEAMLDQLQSPPLGATGLIDGLRKQCDALQFRTGAEVTLTTDPLPPEWALMPGTTDALFRITQEALSNIARHARAWKVSVELGAADGRLTLTIHDNGTGFDPNVAATGIGRASMRARADDLGGEFELWSRPGTGTTIKAAMPYETVTPVEFRNKALATAALAIGLWATYAVRPPSLGSGAVHLAAAMVSVMTAIRYAIAFVRLRRRAALSA